MICPNCGHDNTEWFEHLLPISREDEKMFCADCLYSFGTKKQLQSPLSTEDQTSLRTAEVKE